MTENKYEIGTFGWLREQAKKDGFDNIRNWQIWKNNRKINNIEQVEKMFGDKINNENRSDFYRFWSKVDIKDNIEECWGWEASSIMPNGYGQFALARDSIVKSSRTVTAHYAAYIISKGAIPDGIQVLHLCNNPNCCNPYHLELGDKSKNMKYMYKCGRRDQRGENNGRAKLTEDQVREIHKLYKEQRKLHPGFKRWQITGPIAQKFGITEMQVDRIIRGEQWHYIYEEI